MIAELRDPEHLRSLGAAELSPELIAAVQRTAFARRIMVLELLRREYRSVTDQTSDRGMVDPVLKDAVEPLAADRPVRRDLE